MSVILRFYLFRDLSFEQILFFISKWMFLCCTCFGPSHDCLDLNFHANWGDALFLAPPQLGPIRLFTLLLLKGNDALMLIFGDQLKLTKGGYHSSWFPTPSPTMEKKFLVLG